MSAGEDIDAVHRRQRKGRRITNAREIVLAWFATNRGTAAQAYRATGVGRATVDHAIKHMRALCLPQLENVIAKTRAASRKPLKDEDDDAGFRVPTVAFVETALQRRLPLERAWGGAAD